MLAAFRKRKRELEKPLAEVRGEMKKARRADRAAANATARRWVLKEDLVDDIILMCWQADGELAPAVTYLEEVRRQQHWPEPHVGGTLRNSGCMYLGRFAVEVAPDY